MRFGRLDLRYQKFTHTRPWPRLQHSFPAAQNLQPTNVSDVQVCLWSSFDLSLFLIQTLTLTPPPNNTLLANIDILIRCPLAANFASAVDPCVGIVKPFKLLLRVTAHPQFLALELRVPMGTCPGQYGTTYSHILIYIHIHTHIHTYTYSHIHTHTYSYTYSHILIYIYILTHTPIHTHIP